MNRANFIDEIASEAELSNEKATQFFNAFTTVVQKALSRGDDIILVGFGQFQVVERAARSARDFRSGKTISVPATKVVKFKVGKGLKDAVANS